MRTFKGKQDEREREVPFFCIPIESISRVKKHVKTHIVDLLEKKFAEEAYASLFLIDVTTNEKSQFIRVYIDGDQGVKFSDCQHISRYLEEYLDENPDVGEKYTLEVSSPGVKRPLQQLRQYAQHVGRTLKIKWKDGTNTSAKLVSIDGETILLETLPDKKKKKEIEQFSTTLEEIDEALVKISFN